MLEATLAKLARLSKPLSGIEIKVYFYVDESGHTGTNLFDQNQPMLYYGVLSARTNLDVLAERVLRRARRKVGVDRLHAADLGMGGLVEVSNELIEIQRRQSPVFDMYRVAKPDHALICFFDQVFDQGVNPAVPWSGYWTPLRYVLLLKLAVLFDDELLEEAWRARIDLNDGAAEEMVSQICGELRTRRKMLPDERSQELMADILGWAAENPSELHYNCKSKRDIELVTPNLIGFQFVMQGIARRVKNRSGATKIVVDRQSQFNKAQRTLAEFYANARDIPWKLGPGLPEMDLSNIPDVPIEFYAGSESAGLELVDVYLWLFKRLVEGKHVAPELTSVLKPHMNRGNTDEVSINALAARWSRWFEQLPDPTEQDLETVNELRGLDESRRAKGAGSEGEH